MRLAVLEHLLDLHHLALARRFSGDGRAHGFGGFFERDDFFQAQDLAILRHGDFVLVALRFPNGFVSGRAVLVAEGDFVQLRLAGRRFNGFGGIGRVNFFQLYRLILLFRDGEVRRREGGDEGNGMG